MRVNALQLPGFELLMAFAQHRRMLAKFFVEAGEFALGIIDRAFAHGDDELLLVFDTLAVIEHRLQGEGKPFHVTLIIFASVCSYELVS